MSMREALTTVLGFWPAIVCIVSRTSSFYDSYEFRRVIYFSCFFPDPFRSTGSSVPSLRKL